MGVFFGYFLDSRLWRSPPYQVRGRLFGPATPFVPHAAQCDKESNPRVARKLCSCFR